MKRRQWGLYAVALAVLVVGLVWAGVPASSLLLAGLVLACPLMMLFMMRGMHGNSASGHDANAPGHGGCGHDGHDTGKPVRQSAEDSDRLSGSARR